MASHGPRPVALVTGACSGIGRAIADRLAARGHALVLVSERPGPLEEAAAGIRSAFGVPVEVVCLDLARPGAAEELHRRVRSLGLTVEVLVNNAGTFFFGEAVDATLHRASALLQLHVVTPSLLCTLFGREMRDRRSGRILLVSSISAWRDFPGIAYYGSSKRYLRGFARALRSELSVYGVTVTCLAPGPTATGLYGLDSAAVRRGRRLGLFLDPGRVADQGVRALLAGRAECVPGFSSRAMALLAAAAPQWVVDLVRRRSRWLPKAGGSARIRTGE
jgi:short-subunit dehydrogenase